MKKSGEKRAKSSTRKAATKTSARGRAPARDEKKRAGPARAKPAAPKAARAAPAKAKAARKTITKSSTRATELKVEEKSATARPMAPTRRAAATKISKRGPEGPSRAAPASEDLEARPRKDEPNSRAASGKSAQGRRPSSEPKASEGPSGEGAVKKPGVLRFSAGERAGKSEKVVKPAAAPEAPPAPAKNGTVKTMRRPGRVVELNPRLESARGISKPEPQGQKPMSVAERHRAAAEEAFQKIAPQWSAKEPVPAAPAPAQTHHRSEFDARISERDSLTTMLRLADDGERSLFAARELAQRFRLPPDQNLLMKVITLGDAGLTKLALEELLELDDRGRVRSNEQLVSTVSTLASSDRETSELRELFLEKLGARGA